MVFKLSTEITMLNGFSKLYKYNTIVLLLLEYYFEFSK